MIYFTKILVGHNLGGIEYVFGKVIFMANLSIFENLKLLIGLVGARARAIYCTYQEAA